MGEEVKNTMDNETSTAKADRQQNTAKDGNRLETAPLLRLIFALAIPSVIAQLINVLYNIVDRIYIGNITDIGDIALTGIGVTFPIIMVISAFSAFIGMGGAPLASIKMGEKDLTGAETILGNGVKLLLLLAAFLMMFFYCFKKPLLFLFGASANTFPYGNTYLTIYLMGTPFVLFTLGLNPFISIQGFSKTAMCSVLIGAGLNILLDPLFIFVLHLGVAGAAIATVISQFASAFWVVSFLRSEKSLLKIRKKYFPLKKDIVAKVASLGIAPFIMQSTESLVQITLNSGLQKYGGDIYVGSMTIMISVMQLIIMPINGFTQGAQPIISYNFGAGNMARVKQAFRYILGGALFISLFSWFWVTHFPAFFADIFTDKQELIAVTAQFIPVFFGTIAIFGIQTACQSTFLALGQAKISFFLACLRKIILLVPLAIILPMKFGVEGIYYAEPIADLLAVTTTGTLFLCKFRRILNRRTALLQKKSNTQE